MLSHIICHWTLPTAFVRHRHVSSSANQHAVRVRWSLVCRCGATNVEQSANPLVRLRTITRTIQAVTKDTSLQAYIRLLAAAAPSDSVFCTSISCKEIHISIIDSSLEGWNPSEINDGRWQTIPDKRDSFSEKMMSDNQRHICQEIKGSTPLPQFPPLHNLWFMWFVSTVNIVWCPKGCWKMQNGLFSV